MIQITRDSLVYMSPPAGHDKKVFAQCISCRMFVPYDYLSSNFDGSRCITHGSFRLVGEMWSCGTYAPWPTPDGKPVEEVVRQHAAELEKMITGSYTPEQSGLVARKVQCHRCAHEADGATICALYVKMNEQMPESFSMDQHIEPHACCNAQTPK